MGYAPYDPSVLSPSGWWDAAQITGLSDGDPIASVPDRSGNGNDLETYLGAPAYVESGIGGVPSISFRGGGTIDALMSANKVIPTFIATVAFYDGATFAGYNGLVCAGLAARYYLLGYGGHDYFYPFGAAAAWTDGTAAPSPTAIPGPMNSPSVIEATAAAWYTPMRISVGCDRNIAGRGWKGQISEVIALATTPTDADRQKIEGYLAWKYGLQANLPSDHPYKSAAPGGQIKVWDGTAWVLKPVQMWDGAAWVTKPVQMWNGAAWVLTP